MERYPGSNLIVELIWLGFAVLSTPGYDTMHEAIIRRYCSEKGTYFEIFSKDFKLFAPSSPMITTMMTSMIVGGRWLALKRFAESLTLFPPMQSLIILRHLYEAKRGVKISNIPGFCY